MPLVVTDQCANCRDCLPACPVDCFFEDAAGSRVFINPSECIGCLCCYLICPHDAIYPQDKLPATAADALEVNAQACAAQGARRLTGAAMRHATPSRVQGRSAASAARGEQRPGARAPAWWTARPRPRPPIPSYEVSAPPAEAPPSEPTPPPRTQAQK